ncbi:MAG: DNA (cytosine-5)-methyltransferase 1 [Psychromonas sp.]|jgi:DNA (cytosine-5)-methyltransferase 1
MVKLLDLFCCGGGAAKGYHNAGFEVTGIDIDHQEKYPFEFIQSDAIEYLLANHHLYDAFHASPPCQAHTKAAMQHRIAGKSYPCFIEAVRAAFISIGKPWVIENTRGAPLLDPVEYCGCMFPWMKTYRPRIFESNIKLILPPKNKHTAKNVKMGRPPEEGKFMHVV